MPTATSYSLALGGKKGYINFGGWNTELTDHDDSAQEVCGIRRIEGANEYMYVYLGTATCTWSGHPLKFTTSYADTDSVVPMVVLTQLGATAAGYFSAVGVTLKTWTANTYGWILVRGIATLPVNSNTGLYAVGLPIAPSSSSAGFAECAAASSVGRVATVLGATYTTATQTAEGGYRCIVDFTKSFT